MKTKLEDLLKGVPAQKGNGGRHLTPTVSSAAAKAAEPMTALDKTTASAKRLLDDEALARSEKTARLKAAREDRDKGDDD
ncbi:hypothetical protein KM176_06415 [Pseudooceanicola sp. CBS1P-1]|uniref:Uncharacterized protein n=1 Tax=Pseudooceanicola albus TaxID=2692189 RepID=A0A6L7FZU0_9RHOB|nr:MULTISPECIES: hypothetical protein [Pseudooceanicola]MBT9383485.1 hypothetical protein [Pseudooceanicola endophyticus]MXN17341.1 hypothetical protein [Pseudooceanicola albus]